MSELTRPKGEGKLSEDTDPEMTEAEVNEYLEDLFDNEYSTDHAQQKADLSEPEERPNEFIDLISQLRQLRQTY